ncbi:MAG: response regulator [Pseudomonadota bacterium]
MNSQPRIVLVDDDAELTELLAEFLDGDGFDIRSINQPEEALELDTSAVDAIVLDIMMPRISGLDVLQSLRSRSHTPVLMLTGRGDDIDRIIGLEMGADDYMGKPCNPRELAARLRAILRRTQAVESKAVEGDNISLHGIQLSRGQREASVGGEPLGLTSAEFSVLELLMRAAGEIVSKETLTEKVLQRPLMPYDRSIDVHVSRVRQKLSQHLGEKQLIKTARGRGYMMIQ